MKKQKMSIVENVRLNHDTYQMRLSGDCREISSPGQFIDLAVPEKFLRRPISICRYDDNSLDIWYKVMGGGTEIMTGMKPGEQVDVLIPLGNGFSTDKIVGHPVLVGGGIGVPPMIDLAEQLAKEGRTFSFIFGCNGSEDLLPLDRVRALGVDPVVMTVDGSEGQKGFVTDALDDLDYDYVFACGPSPMLKALLPFAKAGQFSLEERMGCGFGACMGCSIRTTEGNRRVCKDGPVFDCNELIL